MLPEHLERLALRVVVQARHEYQRGLAGLGGRLHVLDKVLALTDTDDLARRGRRRKCLSAPPSRHFAGAGSAMSLSEYERVAALSMASITFG